MDHDQSNPPQDNNPVGEVPGMPSFDAQTPVVPSPSDPVTTGTSSEVNDIPPVVDVVNQAAPATSPELVTPETLPPLSEPVVRTSLDTSSAPGEATPSSPVENSGPTSTPTNSVTTVPPVSSVNSPDATPAKKSKTTLILLIVVIVLIIAAVVYFLAVR